MDIRRQSIESVFTEKRTRELGFTNRVRLDFLKSMRWESPVPIEPIRTIQDLIEHTPFRLNRRPGFGHVTLRYMTAVLASVGIKYP